MRHLWKHGQSGNPAGRNPVSAEIRFWSKIDKNGQVPPVCPERGRCWNWTGATDDNGRALFYDGKGKTVGASRFSWKIHKGPIPSGKSVLHYCDNPSCPNPEHLFLGTQLENIADRDHKKRQARGENHGSAKLTETDVRELRRLYREEGIGSWRLGQRFGISDRHALDIVRGVCWKDSYGLT
jgi:hypothetical protein